MTRNVAELRRQLKQRHQIGRVRGAWEDDDCNGFASPREFLTCVMRAAATAGGVRETFEDPRLASLRVQASAGSDENQTQAMPYGGYLVPAGLLPGFLANTFEGDPLASRVMAVQMASPICHLPARIDESHATSAAGGVEVSRREETGTINTSLLQMRRITLEANGLWGAAFASNEVLMDSKESFSAVLQSAFSDQMSATLMNERLSGTGAGQFLGILNSRCLITVAKDGGQAAATISASNVVNMRARCWGYNNAVWLANHAAYEQIATLALQGASESAVTMLFLPAKDEDSPDMLSSRPIFFTEYCQPLGTPGDLVLGNWSQYIEGTYQRGAADSMHVRFLQHESVFKFWIRNAAQPWWRVPLQPQNSGDPTVSPFIVLAQR